MAKDYYKILNVSYDCSQDDIKNSYRKLALKHHPDKNNGSKESEEIFKLISEAYETLSDEYKRIIYDYDYKEAIKTNNHTKEKSQPVTPDSILELFVELHRKLRYTKQENILQENVFLRVKDLLDIKIINFLHDYGDLNANRNIIKEGIKICDFLKYEYVEKICLLLSNLAGSDSNFIEEIYIFNKKRKRQHIIFERIIPIMKVVIPIILITWFVSSAMNENNNSPIKSDSTIPKTGNLYQPTDTTDNSILESVKTLKKYADWDKKEYNTGAKPGCFNFSPKYDYDIDNKLEVYNSSDMDAVVKLMKRTNNKCIRYVYIRQGETYTITNIPLGEYYTKIAYGNDWRQKIIDNVCLGKFIFRAAYKNHLKTGTFIVFKKTYKGDEEIDGKTYKVYSYNSMSLKLFVTRSNGYSNDGSSEDEFNNDN
jgi:hypothetical protein